MDGRHVGGRDGVGEGDGGAGASSVSVHRYKRDGTMSSPNFDATAALVESTGMAIIASGGVSRMDDIRKVVETGAEAVIVGGRFMRGRWTWGRRLRWREGKNLASHVWHWEGARNEEIRLFEGRFVSKKFLPSESDFSMAIRRCSGAERR